MKTTTSERETVVAARVSLLHGDQLSTRVTCATQRVGVDETWFVVVGPSSNVVDELA